MDSARAREGCETKGTKPGSAVILATVKVTAFTLGELACPGDHHASGTYALQLTETTYRTYLECTLYSWELQELHTPLIPSNVPRSSVVVDSAGNKIILARVRFPPVLILRICKYEHSGAISARDN